MLLSSFAIERLAGFRYTVADKWLPKVIEWNQNLDPVGRFDAAMKAEGLFEVTSAPAP